MSQRANAAKLPALVKRTGLRQICVQMSDRECADLERMRQRDGFRSWGEVMRFALGRYVESSRHADRSASGVMK